MHITKSILIAAMLFASCQLPKQITGMKEPEQSKIKKESAVSDTNIKSGSKEFRGLFFQDKNGATFRDCANPDSVYWVADSTHRLKDLYMESFAHPNPYSSVVAILKGELIPTVRDYLADEHPQTLIVRQVTLVEKKNGSNLCIPFDFWASGSDPNWTLEISEKENLIELNLPDEKKLYYFSYSEPAEKEGYTVYQNYNSVQSYSIEIKIKKESCTDSSTGQLRDYTFEVGLNADVPLKGCGKKY